MKMRAASGPVMFVQSIHQEIDSVYTAEENVNLRREPSEEAERITTIPAGTEVLVEEELANGWTKVIYNRNQRRRKDMFLGEYLTQKELADMDDDIVSRVSCVGSNRGLRK